MLTRDVLATDVPLTNAMRLARWRDKVGDRKLEQWWELTHPDAPALEIESPAARNWRATLPSLLRWQAE